MRIRAYAQLLESYSSLTLKSMSAAFGMKEAFVDKCVYSRLRMACDLKLKSSSCAVIYHISSRPVGSIVRLTRCTRLSRQHGPPHGRHLEEEGALCRRS
ncbi:hypothetical protein JB92DRAFT_3011859 [Gautieria morchelliformis]|nr:hypothetical protein JB92DRAFT_3045521 [Gautieria morchelliformis]KAF8489865.1 hypothetical protein JB92DRAFT_3011859 [Gautieria morchelliformis]